MCQPEETREATVRQGLLSLWPSRAIVQRCAALSRRFWQFVLFCFLNYIQVNILFLPRKLRVTIRIQLHNDAFSNWLCPTLPAR